MTTRINTMSSCRVCGHLIVTHALHVEQVLEVTSTVLIIVNVGYDAMNQSRLVALWRTLLCSKVVMTLGKLFQTEINRSRSLPVLVGSSHRKLCSQVFIQVIPIGAASFQPVELNVLKEGDTKIGVIAFE